MTMESMGEWLLFDAESAFFSAILYMYREPVTFQ
jgi:hypothetical protein